MDKIVKFQSQERSLEPQNMTEGLKLAQILHQSGMFSHLKSPGQVYGVIAKGRELGIPMMTALTDINVIQGKISMSGQLLHAICLSHSEICEYFECIESNETKATYRTKRKGRTEKTHTITMEEMKKMGMGSKDQWQKQPATMLRWRCVSALARMVYPDLLSGCYTQDELSSSSSAPISVEIIEEPKEKEELNDNERAYLEAQKSIDRLPFLSIEEIERLSQRIEQGKILTQEQKHDLLAQIKEIAQTKIQEAIATRSYED